MSQEISSLHSCRFGPSYCHPKLCAISFVAVFIMKKDIIKSLVLALFAMPVASGAGLLVPLYSWPTITAQGTEGDYECDSPHWQKIATSEASNNTIAIVNPNNGPDYSGDAWKKLSYDTCIAYLKENNVEVVGYVHTKLGYPNIYGYRGEEDVKADIDRWEDEYNVDGIFIDEVSNRWLASWDSLQQVTSFYQEMVNYTLNDKGYDRAILNPGTAYFEDIMVPYYQNPKVIAVVFENTQWTFQRENCVWGLWTPAQGSFSRGVWCPYVPNWDGIEPLKAVMENGSILPEQSAVLIYGAEPNAHATETSIHLGLADNVGWFYVVDNWDAWSSSPSDVVMAAQAAMVA